MDALPRQRGRRRVDFIVLQVSIAALHSAGERISVRAEAYLKVVPVNPDPLATLVK